MGSDKTVREMLLLSHGVQKRPPCKSSLGNRMGEFIVREKQKLLTALKASPACRMGSTVTLLFCHSVPHPQGCRSKAEAESSSRVRAVRLELLPVEECRDSPWSDTVQMELLFDGKGAARKGGDKGSPWWEKMATSPLFGEISDIPLKTLLS